MEYYAGMDIGGSHARMVLTAINGTAIGTHTGAGATLNVVGYQTARQLYTAFVKQVLDAHGLSASECRGLCVAASGVDSPALAGSCKEIFTQMGFDPARVFVVNDCEVYLLESSEPGIVLTVGTGSIAYGRKTDGEMVRVGGWGHLLSDEGSGFYMGLRVLQAVGNHLDGRTPCPRLWQLFQDKSPIDDLIDLNAYAADNLSNKPEIAQFAPLLDQGAAQGDIVCRQILTDCVGLLYHLVEDTYEKLGALPAIPVPVLLWGSVLMHSPWVANPLRQKLEASLPVVTSFPAFTALEAALRVAQTR